MRLILLAILLCAAASTAYDYSTPITYMLNAYSKFATFTSTLTDIFSLVPDLLSNILRYSKPTDWSSPTNGGVYDFIIVGSGSAGAVIANRLSENPNYNVLLLEVGKGENVLTRVPVIAPVFQLSPYNWEYLMEFQENFARGMDDRLLAWPRGRALGGTTVINYMIYTRGNPIDFDNWAADGNPGWSYEEVLPYFLKSERANIQGANKNFHNANGLWSVESVYRSPILNAFIRGGEELGYQQVDYTSPDQIGFAPIQASTRRGRRDTVARAFLQPFKNRRNLKILTSSLVTRILIENKTAYGVEYVRKGKKFVVRAKKEVVLSAGALASPQLLMLSGIGPEKHLRDLGIPVVANLPVGRNLHDHITYVGLTFLIDQNVGVSLETALTPRSIFGWLRNGTGPMSSLGGVTGVAYIKTSEDTNPDPRYPDMELIFADNSLNADFGITAKTMRIRDEVYKKYWGPILNVPSWTIFPMLVHPRSTGYMELRSTNILDHPRFFGNYFTDPENKDLKTMIAAIRFVQKLSKTKQFLNLGTRMHDIPVPGCETFPFDSDVYWKCALETLSITLHHQVGTCKMGVGPSAVVNSDLQVYGVNNLRVADTSVIPRAITAHTSAPSVMVGEKAADIIRAAWG